MGRGGTNTRRFKAMGGKGRGSSVLLSIARGRHCSPAPGPDPLSTSRALFSRLSSLLRRRRVPSEAAAAAAPTAEQHMPTFCFAAHLPSPVSSRMGITHPSSCRERKQWKAVERLLQEPLKAHCSWVRGCACYCQSPFLVIPHPHPQNQKQA